MDEQEKRQLIEQYVEAYNRFDVDGMLALLTPDVQFSNLSGSQVNATADGIEAFGELAGQAVALFSARRQTILSFHVGSSSVVAMIAYRGVLAADLPHGPAAGSVIELSGESEFWVAEGRIRRLVDRS